ncbi:peptide chain release factor class I/class II, partial [Talaromyces proteolyticus]
FSTRPACAVKQLPPRPKLDDEDITGSYLKGSGPGGQKINKTNSAVQLIHKPTGIVVKSQATRSRSQNQKIAREILAAKIEELEKGEQSRTAIKAALKRKKKASSMKKKRRKYRALEEEKQTREV